jgi:hypothetical protein
MNGHDDTANMELSKKHNRGGKEPDAEEAFLQSLVIYCKWMGCMCQWSNVIKQVRGVSYHNDLKAIYD